jgi:hypothetical protein
MSRHRYRRLGIHRLTMLLIVSGGLLVVVPARANQLDIPGPAGSGAFGTTVAVLPSGNIVVTDPDPNPLVSNLGAVYLYSPAGALISSFTGSVVDDHVGSGGITVLQNGNFVISSPAWNNGAATKVGAVTWVDGTTGLSGMVSASNSLVGATANDQVGLGGVTALPNGDYVVASYNWTNGANSAAAAGAVTWANGSMGRSGQVSATNSLVGTAANDQVGVGVTVLRNGNYVVESYYWNNGATHFVGAVTWALGSIGLSGPVSTTNSLVGTTAGDSVGYAGVVALSNGNYVVASNNWTNGAATQAGAVTWANGAAGLSGPVSAANSLVGTTNQDAVGQGGVTALSNGNYVVASYDWHNGTVIDAGAVTWANGGTGLSGPVSATNSLVGTTIRDAIGEAGVTALNNGNYVVASFNWNNDMDVDVGAVTWANGSTGLSGVVSVSNSLVGSTFGDSVGFRVTALSNGNYVASTPFWQNGAMANAGAATWANGSTGLSGTVSAANSLVGTTAGDYVSLPPYIGSGVAALANGNYAVASYNWSNGATHVVGAVTWVDGSTGLSGPVSAINSLVGITANDSVGSTSVTALSDGNYVVASDGWANGAATQAGAATWANGRTGLSGHVSVANSLVGTLVGDSVGTGLAALSNGNYVVASSVWNNGMTSKTGAVSLGRRNGGLVGPILATNSVRGTTANGGTGMVFAYDATRDQLVVGQPASNIVSLFKADLLFVNGFE